VGTGSPVTDDVAQVILQGVPSRLDNYNHDKEVDNEEERVAVGRKLWDERKIRRAKQDHLARGHFPQTLASQVEKQQLKL